MSAVGGGQVATVKSVLAGRYVIILFAMLSMSSLAVFGLAAYFDVLKTPTQLAKLQLTNPELIVLPADLRFNGGFKLARIAQDRPDIICISSSRAGAFRDWMFKPYRFYNASFTAWTTQHLLDVFERLTRDVRPRVVILEIDYFLFTDTWGDGYATERAMIYDPFRYLKFKLARLLVQRSRGLFEEYGRQDGFRGDGSYAYPPGFIEMARTKYQTANDLVQAAPGAAQMSARQMAPIAQLAELARLRGIKLIALQLPFVHAAVDYLDHNDAYRPYAGVWRDFESDQTEAWLRSLGISFFDLARSPIDDNPLNFMDAYHPVESGMVAVLHQLMEQPAFRAELPRLDGS